MAYTFFKHDINTSLPDPNIHVQNESYFGQASLRRLGHRQINMEFPEDYPYPTKAPNLKDLKQMGHTVAPGIGGYTLYTPASSDNLISRDLYTTWAVADTKKAEAGLATSRTPFMEAPGIKTRPLAGFTPYKKGGARNMTVKPLLPPIGMRTQALRDTATMDSCNGNTSRLLSVLTNSTPVFVDTRDHTEY